MENSKLLILIKTLSPNEIKDFDWFLKGPYYKGGPDGIKLFNLLSANRPDYIKETIFKKLYPSKPYDDKSMRYLMHDLNKALEKFIACKDFMKNENAFSFQLQESLNQRDCQKALAEEMNRQKSFLDDFSTKDQFTHYSKYLAEYNTLLRETKLKKRGDKGSLEKVLDELDKFYLSVKLQLSCEIYNVQNVLSVQYKTLLLDEIMDHLETNKYEDTPLIKIYYTIYQTLTHQDSQIYFESLLKLLKKHEAELSGHDLRDAYQYVFNYCIKHINKGNSLYMATLFNAYKATLRTQVMLERGMISQWDYKNIVTIGLKLKEFKWVESFINEYKNKLPLVNRENAYSYNLANLYFNTKQFNKATTLLQKVNFTDLYYQLDTRAILLKIYFESEDAQSFEYHVSAFKMFLRRNRKISEYQKTIYKNLILFTSSAYRLRERGKSVDALKKEAIETRQIADYNWLINQLESVNV